MTQEPSFESIERSLKRAAAALSERDIPFMLGGSLAAWARGGPPSHNDLDLVVRPADAERALAALVDAGMEPERPPEDWLLKANDDGVTIDVIFKLIGLDVTDELIDRAERIEVAAMSVRVMDPEDVLSSKLLALNEHSLDFEGALQMARALREQIEWREVERRTGASPYARAFFGLLEELAIVSRDAQPLAGALGDPGDGVPEDAAPSPPAGPASRSASRARSRNSRSEGPAARRPTR